MGAVFTSFPGLDRSLLEWSITIILKSCLKKNLCCWQDKIKVIDYKKRNWGVLKNALWLMAGRLRTGESLQVLHSLGWGAKSARFALTYIGCWKTWELIRSCSSAAAPCEAKSCFSSATSYSAFPGCTNGQLQQIIASAVAVFPQH